MLLAIFIVPRISWSEEQMSTAEEMARKLQDPLASFAALMTDNDILFNSGNGSTSYSFQLQPVYALDFPDLGFSFIPRAVIHIIGAAPQSDLPILDDPVPPVNSTVWGLGDIVTQFFFAPKTKFSWKYGFGPQFSWRSRTDENLGGPGWGAGAAVVLVGNITKQLSFGGIVNQMWSYDGTFSTMGIVPNLYYNLGFLPGAYVAYNATISADWKASSGNNWTLPLGAIAGKTIDMGRNYGVDLSVGPYWNAVKPDGGADWFLKFGLTVLFPS